MRRHHDGFVLLFTLVPIAIAVWAFFVWYNTGQLPLGLSLADLPVVSLPNIPIPQSQINLPPQALQATDWLGRNTWALIFGTGAGIFAGFIAIGTAADTIRVLGRRLLPPRPVSPLPEPQSGDDIS